MVMEGAQPAADEWVTFPGGELEGKRPKALCPSCREALEKMSREGRGRPGRSRLARSSRAPRPICFQCYRAELDRARTIQAAGALDTASDVRFQFQLPFEPVNRPRLEALKAERAMARATIAQAEGPYADRRRHAQLEARHALQRVAAGLTARGLATANPVNSAARDRALFEAVHAAELQLPEAWLPFVVAR